MTSTSFNVGLKDDTRASSRVLRPPGGGHTDIFGSEPEPPIRTGRRQAPAIPTSFEKAEQSSNSTEAPKANGVAQPEPATQPEQAATPEAVVTPDAKPTSPAKEAQPGPTKMEPPKRVRVPPGGFSSGLW